MYNSSDRIIDEEFTHLTYNQKINKDFTVEEILNSPLWHTETSDTYFRAIPLFNCDKIVSYNDNDTVLDENQLISIENKSKNVIKCISDDTGSIHYYDIKLNAYTPINSLRGLKFVKIYCVVYDEYFNTFDNVEVEVYSENTLIGTTITNNEGICEYIVKEPLNYIYFKYNNVNSDVIDIVG